MCLVKGSGLVRPFGSSSFVIQPPHMVCYTPIYAWNCFQAFAGLREAALQSPFRAQTLSFPSYRSGL